MAGTATVLIEGEIRPENSIRSGMVATSLSRVQAQIKSAGSFEKIQVIINSEGGDCFEGWAIYDYLTLLRKPITTIVVGQCCSMATVLFLAGRERLISEHSEFMIHLPWGGVEGNQNEIRKYLEFIERESQKILDFYAKKTGFDESKLADMMAAETFMSPSEVIKCGFATGIYSSPVAYEPRVYATRKPVALAIPPQATQSSNHTMSTKSKNSFASRLKSLLGIAEGAEIKALSVTITTGPDGTAGKTLDIETVGENGIAIGDPATIEGAPAPDGAYELSDQTRVVVTDGAVSDIPAEETAEEPTDENPSASAEETVTISKAEYDQLTALQAQASANANAATELANLKGRIKAVLGGRDLSELESKDVNIQPAGKVQGDPQARNQRQEPALTPGQAAIERRKLRQGASAA